ncbi:Uncharacterised protein [Mycobacteroides abscessus subsp. abscessus]|nr:Uncharacterised protein [Mycobacteroides abscessus subsp. abscessus]SII46128.1 Uncharacterised protein [Mycobacteroides abscessus subsp. abscessus]SKT79545.1 Uncharacterised protein [Mycobacteroides abscessus subsp. abscessus]
MEVLPALHFLCCDLTVTTRVVGIPAPKGSLEAVTPTLTTRFSRCRAFGDRPLHPAGLYLLRRDLELPPRHATETSSRAGTSPVYRNHDEKGVASAL